MPKMYGVSIGDGNNGVSHAFPDYYVRTDDPWLLAKAAAIDTFDLKFGQEVSKALDVDGDEQYTISATIYDEGDVTGKYESYECEGSAFFILEVFHEDDVDCIKKRSCPIYDSIEDALSAEAIAIARKG